jgi:hypothetical protein
MGQHRLRILYLSDLHERVLLKWMMKERKAEVRAMSATRHFVLGGGQLQLRCASLAAGYATRWPSAEQF